jgi:hypothetical protein
VITEEIREKLILLLVSGLGEAAQREAATKLGLEPEEIDPALAETKRRIQIAADYNRDQQIGTAVVRLNDLYRRALAIQDTKTALAAQKELSRLLCLYSAPAPAAGERPADQAGEVEAIRAHLEPLDLGGENDSTEELARRAALRILAADAATNPPQPTRRRPNVHRKESQPARPASRKS